MLACALELIVTPLGAVVGIVIGIGLHLVLPAFLYIAGVRSKEPQ